VDSRGRGDHLGASHHGWFWGHHRFDVRVATRETTTEATVAAAWGWL